MPPRVGAVVLAAGSSRRLGRNKLLLELGGESLVRRCARRAIAAGLDPVTVVVGFEAEAVVSRLDGLACETVRNEHHASGQHGSVKCGLAAMPDDVEAVVIVLADMVGVTTEMLREVAELHRESRAPLVVSRYADVVAPPTLYDRRLFPELLALDDGAATRRVLQRHEARAAVARWPESALVDIDDPEDLVRWIPQG